MVHDTKASHGVPHRYEASSLLLTHDQCCKLACSLATFAQGLGSFIHLFGSFDTAVIHIYMAYVVVLVEFITTKER